MSVEHRGAVLMIVMIPPSRHSSRPSQVNAATLKHLYYRLKHRTSHLALLESLMVEVLQAAAALN